MLDDGKIEFNIEFNAGEHTIEATTRVPTAAMRVADLLPILRAFDDAVAGLAADNLERQGKPVSCRAGCAACCRQLVPISESEAHSLAELVEALPPDRQAAVRNRFEKALAALAEHGLLEPLRKPEQLKAIEDRRRIGAEYFRLQLSCPFLEEERCSIYLERPLRCREYMVTSPAENCWHPSAETIRMAPLPAKFSEILFTFDDGVGNAATRWLPLDLALEWAAGQKDTPQLRLPGAELFRNFVKELSTAGGGDPRA
jgi:Fe-S-cluster containining protein